MAACSLCGRPLALPEVVKDGALVHFACGTREAIHLPTLAELLAAGLPHKEICRQLWLNFAIRTMWDAIERRAA